MTNEQSVDKSMCLLFALYYCEHDVPNARPRAGQHDRLDELVGHAPVAAYSYLQVVPEIGRAHV